LKHSYWKTWHHFSQQHALLKLYLHSCSYRWMQHTVLFSYVSLQIQMHLFTVQRLRTDISGYPAYCCFFHSPYSTYNCSNCKERYIEVLFSGLLQKMYLCMQSHGLKMLAGQEAALVKYCQRQCLLPLLKIV